MNPAHVVESARLVEVVYDVGGEYVGRASHHHHTPRSGERQRHLGFGLGDAGCEPRGERHRGVVEVEVHGRIVDEGRLVDIYISAGFVAHQERCLHACGRETGLRHIAGLVVAVPGAYAAEGRFSVFVFLRVIVARNPPCRMIAGHGKLREFLGYEQRVCPLLLRKHVAEADAVVVGAELHVHLQSAVFLLKAYSHRVVHIGDGVVLAPYGCPFAVVGVETHTFHSKSACKVFFMAEQAETECRGAHYGVAIEHHAVNGFSGRAGSKFHGYSAVGRCQAAVRRTCACGKRKSRQHAFKK